MTEEIHIYHHNEPPPKQRRLGCAGLLGVLLVIGAILSQPAIFVPLTVAVVAVIVIVAARRKNEQQKSQGQEKQKKNQRPQWPPEDTAP